MLRGTCRTGGGSGRADKKKEVHFFRYQVAQPGCEVVLGMISFRLSPSRIWDRSDGSGFPGRARGHWDVARIEEVLHAPHQLTVFKDGQPVRKGTALSTDRSRRAGRWAKRPHPRHRGALCGI